MKWTLQAQSGVERTLQVQIVQTPSTWRVEGAPLEGGREERCADRCYQEPQNLSGVSGLGVRVEG